MSSALSWHYMPQVLFFSEDVFADIIQLEESDPQTYTNEKIRDLIEEGFVDNGGLKELVGTLEDREATEVEKASAERTSAAAKPQLQTIHESTSVTLETGESGNSSPSSVFELKGTPGSVAQYQRETDRIFQEIMEGVGVSKQYMIHFLMKADPDLYDKEYIVEMHEDGSMTDGTLEMQVQDTAEEQGVSYECILLGEYSSAKTSATKAPVDSAEAAEVRVVSSKDVLGKVQLSPLDEKVVYLTQNPSEIPFELQVAMLEELKKDHKLTSQQRGILGNFQTMHYYSDYYSPPRFKQLSDLIPDILKKHPGLLKRVLIDAEQTSSAGSPEQTATVEADTSFEARVTDSVKILTPEQRTNLRAEVEEMAQAKAFETKVKLWENNPSLTPPKYQLAVVEQLIKENKATDYLVGLMQRIEEEIASEHQPINKASVKRDKGKEASKLPQTSIEILLKELNNLTSALIRKDPGLLRRALEQSQ